MPGGTQTIAYTADPDGNSSRVRTRTSLRIALALLLLAVAAVHLNLYTREDYDKIPTVGWLFVLTAVSAVALAATLLGWPRNLSVALAGLFAIGVLGGYLLTLLLPDGLFNFKEPGISYSGFISIVAESAIVLLSVLMLARHRKHSRHPGSTVAAR